MTFELPTLSFTARDKIFGNMSVLTRLQNKAMQRPCNNQFNCKNEQSRYVTGTYRTPAVFKFKCHRTNISTKRIRQTSNIVLPLPRVKLTYLPLQAVNNQGLCDTNCTENLHEAVLAIKHRLYINTAVQTVAHLRK